MSDADRAREEAPRKPSLMRSGAVTGVAQASRALTELCGTLVLARLLAPEAFGLVGMVLSVVVFARLFQDAGLSAATIQRDTLDQQQLSTLFWLNLGAGIAIGAVFAAMAPLIAWFFDDPRLVAITLVAALSFPLQGASNQHLAVLKRHLRFGRLAIVEASATLVSWSLGVVAALAGWDYWSLLVRLLADVMTTLVLGLLLADFRPRLEFGWRATAPLVHFGKHITGFNLVNTLARNLDDVLIGRFWGAHALGLYQRAYQLLMLPLNNVNAPIGKIAVPTLSREIGDEARYKKTFTSLLRSVLLLTLPLGGYLSAVAEPLVVLVLGEPWRKAADIFLALSLLLMTQPLANAIGWLFISQGRSRDMLRWGLVGAGLSILSFGVGLPYGAVGVAWAYSVSGVFVRLPLVLWLVGRQGPVSARALCATLLPFLGLALLVHLAARSSLALLDDPGLLAQVLVPLAAGLLTVAALLGLTRLGRGWARKSLGVARGGGRPT